MPSVSYRQTLREALRLRGDTNFDLAMVERLLDAIELRLRPVEDKKASLEAVEQLIRDVGLQRINDVLTPAIQSVLLIQERGFLLARSSTPATLAPNNVLTFVIEDEHERAVFVPGPYPALTREGSADDMAVARLIAWEPGTGELMVEVISVFGDPGPHDDWVIVATAGVANAMADMLAEARALAGQVTADRQTASDAKDAAISARNTARDYRDAAEGYKNAAAQSASDAALFDPSSYYLKAQTYSKTEVDAALSDKLEAEDLTAASTSFANAGTGLAAEDVQAALEELQEDKAPAVALALHFRNMRVFLTSGTFDPPPDVARGLVIPINGGQGGGSGNGSITGKAGDGGDAAICFVDFTGPVAVTIGSGGTGATGTGSVGQTDGGATSFGALTTANAAASGGFRLGGDAGGTGGGTVTIAEGGSSGFGGTRGKGGNATVSNGTAGTAGACIVMW